MGRHLVIALFVLVCGSRRESHAEKWFESGVNCYQSYENPHAAHNTGGVYNMSTSVDTHVRCPINWRGISPTITSVRIYYRDLSLQYGFGCTLVTYYGNGEGFIIGQTVTSNQPPGNFSDPGEVTYMDAPGMALGMASSAGLECSIPRNGGPNNISRIISYHVQFAP